MCNLRITRNKMNISQFLLDKNGKTLVSIAYSNIMKLKIEYHSLNKRQSFNYDAMVNSIKASSKPKLTSKYQKTWFQETPILETL